MYIADSSSRILQVSTSGNILSIAGTGDYTYSGDGGVAKMKPFGIGVDASGTISHYFLPRLLC